MKTTDQYNCKVSVLVAVYNASNYLRKCLDSLCLQTLKNIEILCTDDASTDDSLSILKEYEHQDPRIRVFSLSENHGQAYARNVALRKATGRYITFLDSDDWMEPDSLEKSVKVFERYPDTGCVLFHVKVRRLDGTCFDFPMKPFEKMSGYDAFIASLTWKIHGWYITRAEIFKQYPYDESARYFSDDNSTRFHYFSSKEVRCSEGVYNYFILPQSVSRQITVRRFDYLIANTSMRRGLDAMNLSKDVYDIYENHRWLNIVDMYMFYFVHRRELGPKDASMGLTEIKRAWKTIEVWRLKPRNRFKFGYMPLQWSWVLFRLEEELYFTLRKWIKPSSLLPPKNMFYY